MSEEKNPELFDLWKLGFTGHTPLEPVADVEVLRDAEVLFAGWRSATGRYPVSYPKTLQFGYRCSSFTDESVVEREKLIHITTLKEWQMKNPDKVKS